MIKQNKELIEKYNCALREHCDDIIKISPGMSSKECKIPYEFLVYDSRRDTFTLSKAMDKRVKMLAYSWLPDKIVKGDYCNISVIEYETLKELEAIRKRMNKYGFHTDINGEFDEE